MSTTPIDSNVFRGLFGTEAMREVFSDKARVRGWLEVEAALARVEGRLGIIPEEAAQEIAAKAETMDVDLAALGAGTERAGFPIIALVDKSSPAHVRASTASMCIGARPPRTLWTRRSSSRCGTA